MAFKTQSGRLSLWHAAFVVARRDITAILFSRTFIFFLLGPLFPVVVIALAGGLGSQVQNEALTADVGIAMQSDDLDAMMDAREELAEKVGFAIPSMVELERLEPGEEFNAAQVLEQGEGQLAAVVTGTLANPRLTAPSDNLQRWEGTISMIAATAARTETTTYPPVETISVTTSGATENRGRYQTAQGGMTLLFLLMMLLAGMVLSNLVEEKGNKIIEILAAAIPMDAVFIGKLFAMLGISVIGILVWGTAGATLLALAGRSLSEFANPGVGWPLFFTFGALYFGMGYLLLGSLFLTIGSMAATVREVQTLSMPVTMAQVLVFFFANLAVTRPGEWIEYAAMIFPLSSPYAMLSRAAVDEAIWPHLLALGWQAICVAVFVRVGSNLFRKKVMKSGPQGAKKSRGLSALIASLFRNGSQKKA